MNCSSEDRSKNTTVCVSIVSHGQAEMVSHLLSDLDKSPDRNFEVVITVNIPEDLSHYRGFGFPISIIENAIPQGFGDNHNKAFLTTNAVCFAVVNPDIRLRCININDMAAALDSTRAAAIAPLVFSPKGFIDDSARNFPTVYSIIKRVLFGRRRLDYNFADRYTSVDWVAGMFVIFKSLEYKNIGGFDAGRFFMYFEDVDICKRLRSRGSSIIVDSKWSVIHDAQRSSHRSVKHFVWHATSMFRFFTGF